MSIFRTDHFWHDSTGGECHCTVEVEYTFYRGEDDSLEEPGYSDHVEVQSVTSTTGDDIGDVDLEAFADECLADHYDRAADAIERRAEARRDDLMMERGA